jgi:broad specificity phosphatase PhoE
VAAATKLVLVRHGAPLMQEVPRRQRWDIADGAEPDETFAARIAAGLSSITRLRHGSKRLTVVAVNNVSRPSSER